MKIEKLDENKLVSRQIEIHSNLLCKILIVKSKYNEILTNSICNGIVNELTLSNVDQNAMGLENIPGGAFEIPLATKRLISKIKPKIMLNVIQFYNSIF